MLYNQVIRPLSYLDRASSLNYTGNDVLDVLNFIYGQNVVVLHTTKVVRIFHDILSLKNLALNEISYNDIALTLRYHRVIYLDCNACPHMFDIFNRAIKQVHLNVQDVSPNSIFGGVLRKQIGVLCKEYFTLTTSNYSFFSEPSLFSTGNSLLNILNYIQSRRIIVFHTTEACKIFHDIFFLKKCIDNQTSYQELINTLVCRRYEIIYLDCNSCQHFLDVWDSTIRMVHPNVETVDPYSPLGSALLNSENSLYKNHFTLFLD